MKSMRYVFGILLVLLLTNTSFASSTGLTYHGRILKPDGNSLEAAAVQFTVQIRSPGNEACLLYQETQTIDMRDSGGVFSLEIGANPAMRAPSSVDGGFSLSKIFGNQGTLTLPNCNFGSSYTPNTADGRLLYITFNDGSGFQTLSPQKVTFVPYAIEAMQLSGYTATQFLRVDTGSAPVLTPANLTTLSDLFNGTLTFNTTGNVVSSGTVSGSEIRSSTVKIYNGSNYVQLTAPPLSSNVTLRLPVDDGNAGQVLQTDGAGILSWVTPASGSGTITTVSVNAPLVDTGTATAPNISIAVANASSPGYLTSADWSAFHSKQSSTLTTGKIWIGNSSGAAAEATMSGDATISTSGLLSLKNTGTVGTYFKVVTDAQGRVSSGSGLLSGDVISALGYTPSAAVSGITNLNGLSTNTQSFVIGTAGNAPAVTSSGSAHTFDFPMASASGSVTAGLISNVDYVSFSGKQSKTLAAGQMWVGNASGAAQAFALSGDVSSVSNSGSVTVNKTTTAQNNMILSLDGSGVGNVKGIGFVNTGTVTMSAATASATYALKLPAAAPGNNQILQSNSTGDLSWVSNIPTVNNATSLAAGKIWIGNASGIAVENTMSGDATVSNLGLLTLKNTGIVGTYFKVITDAQGRVASGSALASGDVTTALGYTPASSNSGFINGGNSFGASATLGTNDANSLAFKTNNATRVTIDNSGNIGVGTATAYGLMDLEKANADVFLNLRNTSSSAARTVGIQLENFTGNTANTGPTSFNFIRHRGSMASPAAIQNNDIIGQLGAYGDFGAGSLGQGAQIYFQADGNYSASSFPTSIHFVTTPSGSNSGQERLTILGSGDVGIGVTSPKGTLHIGNASATGSGYSPLVIGTQSSAHVGIDFDSIQAYNNNSTSTLYLNYWGGDIGFGDMSTARFDRSTGGFVLSGVGGVQVNGTGTVTTNSGNIYTSTGKIGAGGVPSYSIDAGTNTDALRLPRGTTAQQPANAAGLIRYNTTNSNVEFNNGSGWAVFSTGGVTTSLASTQLWIGNASGGAQAQTISGDATISSAGLLTLKNTGTVGTYWKVVTDAQGRVSSGSALLSADVTTALGFTPASSSSGFVNGGNTVGANATLGTNDNYDLSIETNNTTQMTVTKAGKVGIGITAPWDNFMVYKANAVATASVVSDNTSTNTARYPEFTVLNYMGSPGTGSGGNPSFNLLNSRGNSGTPAAMKTGESLGAFVFNGSSDTSGNYLEGASIWAITTQNFSSTAGGTQLQFYTTANNTTTGQPRMTVDQNGYVGIGSASPQSLLQVGATNISSTSWTTQGKLLYIPGATLTDTSGSGTITDRTVASIGTSTLAASSAETITNASSLLIAGAPSAGTNVTITNPFALYVGSGNSYFGGNVGIGTTTTNSGLQVATGSVWTTSNWNKLASFGSDSFASTAIEFHAGASRKWGVGATTFNNGLHFFTTTSSGSSGAPTTALQLTAAGDMVVLGCISYNGSTIGTCLSDERVKKDIQSFDLGLNEIVQLRPVSYKYNGKAGTPTDENDRLGFVAQEVEKSVPALTEKYKTKLNPSDTEDTELTRVKYGALTYALINSMKELYNKWFTDHGRIAELEKQNRELKDALCEMNPKSKICQK